MALGHQRCRHGEQNAVGVHQPELLSLPCKGHRQPLHHRDANLVRQQPHHRGPLHPGHLLQLLAPLTQRNKEDVAADVFAEDREHLRTAHLGQPGGLDVAGPGNAEALVAHNISFEKKDAHGQPAKDDQSAQPQKHAAPRARRTPPGTTRPVFAWPAGAPTTGARGIVVVRVHHLQRHAGSAAADAPIREHTLLHAPEARLRGRFIFPYKGTVCVAALSRHA